MSSHLEFSEGHSHSCATLFTCDCRSLPRAAGGDATVEPACGTHPSEPEAAMEDPRKRGQGFHIIGTRTSPCMIFGGSDFVPGTWCLMRANSYKGHAQLKLRLTLARPLSQTSALSVLSRFKCGMLALFPFLLCLGAWMWSDDGVWVLPVGVDSGVACLPHLPLHCNTAATLTGPPA